MSILMFLLKLLTELLTVHVTSTDKHLTMLLEGHTCHQRLKLHMLLDTGATVNFVSPKALTELKLPYQPADDKLRLADNTETDIVGKVKLKIKIQHFVALVPCYVTDLCQDFDVILGNSFLTGHKAVLDFDRHTVQLTRDGK